MAAETVELALGMDGGGRPDLGHNRSFAPLGLDGFPLSTHGLRRGLHSYAASRLEQEWIPLSCRAWGCDADSRVSTRADPVRLVIG